MIMLAIHLSGSAPATLPVQHASVAAQSHSYVMAPCHTQYYWYSYPDDTYNDYQSLSDEINEMWAYYGLPVDTNPGGGTLIERGYQNNSYPHIAFPVLYLYVHY